MVNGQAIRVTAEKNPADLKWNEVGAEYVGNPPACSSKEKAQATLTPEQKEW